MEHRVDRIGETKIANNGMKMTIVEYRNCRDIDVLFEDGTENGTLVQHRYYYHFKSGTIGYPGVNTLNQRYKQKCIGETNIANNGMEMKIVGYRDATDIDVEFADGTIVNHVNYGAFRQGAVRCPDINEL